VSLPRHQPVPSSTTLIGLLP